MTFSAMRAEVLRRLGENPAAPAWYTAAEAGAAINEAQRLFAMATLAVEKTATVTLPANSPLLDLRPLLAALIAPFRVSTAAGARLFPSSIEAMAAIDSRFLGIEGAPRFYAMAGALMVVTPQPAAPLNLSVLYAATPADLSADGDQPELPEEDHAALIDRAFYVLVSVKEGASRRQEAEPAQAAFAAAIEARAELVRARVRAAAYDTEPFETRRYFHGR